MGVKLTLSLLPKWASQSLCLALACAAFSGVEAQVFFLEGAAKKAYSEQSNLLVISPSSLKTAPGQVSRLPTYAPGLIGRDAIDLQWQSQPGGQWAARLLSPNFSLFNLSGLDSLQMWVQAPDENLAADLLPRFRLESSGGNAGAPIALGDLLPAGLSNLQAGRWYQLSVAIEEIRRLSEGSSLDLSRVNALRFEQGQADGQMHRLLVDYVSAQGLPTGLDYPAPSTASIEAWPLHHELRFRRGSIAPPFYAVRVGGEIVKLLRPQTDTLSLLWRLPGTAGQLELIPVEANGSAAGPALSLSLPASPEASDSLMMDMVQRYTLRYFWDFAHPVSGLSRERNTSGELVTIGGSGFGIMAWLVGIERGWLERQQVAERLAGTLTFLEQADRFRGVWPHWMNGASGRTLPFSSRDDGGDLVETAFMVQALLTARQYFDASTPLEDSIRARCTRLWEAVNWDSYRRPGEQVLTWHWSPVHNWAINLKIRGFNEAQIIYLLALASPTHPVPSSSYTDGWLNNNYRSFQGRYGIFIPAGPRSGGPMFFAHYSYLGFDPRYWKDQYTNYFRRNRLHADYQVAYAADNPENHLGYRAEAWGLTASDDPLNGYAVHAADESEDNGTITPTAALASMPYVPEASMAAIRHFYSEYGPRLFGPMGFYDAFNPGLSWYTDALLAIDQGPIIGMIENHRSGLLWHHFMANPEIEPALRRAGFQPDSLTLSDTSPGKGALSLKHWPNPSTGSLHIEAPRDGNPAQAWTLSLYDDAGRLAFQQNLPASSATSWTLQLPTLAAGTYRLLLQQENLHYTSSLLFQPTP